jgi:uncharacterized membrane protein HdeD (DUF308 family)
MNTMAIGPPTDMSSLPGSELEELRHKWGWFLALGIALIVVGIGALVYSVIASVVTILVFGILLLIGSGLQLANAVWARRWGGFFLHVLVAVLYFVTGMLMLEKPIQGAIVLTLVVAAFLLVGGLFRIIVSLTERFAHWGWALLSGVISFILGLAIWRQWPLDGLWIIGLFVGIEMIFSGWTWVMLGLAVRSFARPANP